MLQKMCQYPLISRMILAFKLSLPPPLVNNCCADPIDIGASVAGVMKLHQSLLSKLAQPAGCRK